MNRPKKVRPDGPTLIFANDGWVNFSAFVAPSRQHQVEVTEVRLAVTVHVAHSEIESVILICCKVSRCGIIGD